MEGIHVFDQRVIRPLARFGLTHHFWDINRDTLMATFVALALLIVFIVVVRIGMRRQGGLFAYAVIAGTRMLKEMVTGGLGIYDEWCFSFVAGITMFTLSCNIVEVLPFGEAATSDVNTAIAIGTTSFLFVQLQGLRFKGRGYFVKYFSPIFVFFPINLIGQFSKIASLSFRLFGNIVGGSVIVSLVFALFTRYQLYLVPFMVVSLLAYLFFRKYVNALRWPKVASFLWYGVLLSSVVTGVQFFSIGEGVIQAGVVGLLTTVYLSSEVKEGAGD